MRNHRLHQINHTLYVLNLILAAYLVLVPILPEINFWVKRLKHPNPQTTNYLPRPFTTMLDASAIPAHPTLIIPKIYLDGQIHMGSDPALLLQGIWHRPNSSTPPQGGNTVLTAHRFQYTTGSNTFYHLDKLKIGDRFVIYWDQIKYSYVVKTKKTVAPTDLSIEQQTGEDMVTLYTCTPLFTAQNRLVIQATPILK